MITEKEESLLQVQDLKKHFSAKTSSLSGRKGKVYAVDGVSFSLKKGETLGIVGESGCGKSTMAKTVIRLLEPTDGKIFLDGEEFTNIRGEALNKARKKIKLIFQDPYSSLNARITVKDIIGEYLDIAKEYKTRSERDDRIAEVMEEVGLDLDFMDRYPHEFSGGQRQRIGIARAIVLPPKLIICDEPVSALDVSIQAKIINLLMDIQHRMDMGYIFISHDLSVVKHISNRVGVMYLGHLVELSDRDELYRNPLNPYTQALFSAIPRIEQGYSVQKIVLTGDVPNPANPPSGCCFHTRCPYAMDICKKVQPELKEIKPGHSCACHLHS
jgi:peptide/nickel transport system ATP-binding protein/oligopeptide transport system ATP-binding protein